MILVEVIELIVEEDRSFHFLFDSDSLFALVSTLFLERVDPHVAQIGGGESICVARCVLRVSTTDTVSCSRRLFAILEAQLLDLVTHGVEHDSNAQEHNSEE